MSNLVGDDGSFSSGNTEESETRTQNKRSELKTNFHGENTSLPPAKKKRSLPGTPDPTAEVIALSPSSLMATNRFVCEICRKGFQRDQNLQLHRRGHNLPWKLKQRTSSDARKRVYVCPELSCVHHNPTRALGDLTGIKKHYSRKHGEKKWKCDRCLKQYAVQSDWKAHLKTCGTREYKCDCGTIFSRKDSFITHRAFCDALAEENNKVNQGMLQSQQMTDHYSPSMPIDTGNSMSIGFPQINNYNMKSSLTLHSQEIPMLYDSMNMKGGLFSSSSGALLNNPRGEASSTYSLELGSSNGSLGFENFQHENMDYMCATNLLHKATEIGATTSNITSETGPNQPNSDGPRPSPSYFDDHGPFHNIQTQPEGSNASQKPIGQEPFGPGPKPNLGVDPDINDIGIYSEVLRDGDQSLGLMNMEHADRRNSNMQDIGDLGLGRHMSGGNDGGGGGGGDDTLIVDFLGIG